ncbi:hypothetical protein LTR36_009528 [Oleoguttula mirabilis]|uniref:Uncharacterized protein n=1 Tax=Oleoguttula mirabilis TaxID=1507867 RepID=A0AAV9JVK7_9PEZI|nr:hypothetical protein LTR36_009528 [Oleoguttula mirabilis]
MQLTTIITALSLLGVACARIIGMEAPQEIAAGSDFTITIITQNYIQSVLDVSAAFGLATTMYPDSLGTYLTSTYLGPEQSNVVTNISVTAVLSPSYAQGSKFYLTAAFTSLGGALSEVRTRIYSVPITIAASTSSEIFYNTFGVDSCSSASSTVKSRDTTTAANLNTLITTVQSDLTALIEYIISPDSASAQSQYSSTGSLFDDVLAQVALPRGTCSNTTTDATLNGTQAIYLIQDIQGTLSKVSVQATNGDDVEAFTNACTALTNYFDNGLHEYFFGA